MYSTFNVESLLCCCRDDRRNLNEEIFYTSRNKQMYGFTGDIYEEIERDREKCIEKERKKYANYMSSIYHPPSAYNLNSSSSTHYSSNYNPCSVYDLNNSYSTTPFSSNPNFFKSLINNNNYFDSNYSSSTRIPHNQNNFSYQNSDYSPINFFPPVDKISNSDNFTSYFSFSKTNTDTNLHDSKNIRYNNSQNNYNQNYNHNENLGFFKSHTNDNIYNNNFSTNSELRNSCNTMKDGIRNNSDKMLSINNDRASIDHISTSNKKEINSNMFYNSNVIKNSKISSKNDINFIPCANNVGTNIIDINNISSNPTSLGIDLSASFHNNFNNMRQNCNNDRICNNHILHNNFSNSSNCKGDDELQRRSKYENKILLQNVVKDFVRVATRGIKCTLLDQHKLGHMQSFILILNKPLNTFSLYTFHNKNSLPTHFSTIHIDQISAIIRGSRLKNQLKDFTSSSSSCASIPPHILLLTELSLEQIDLCVCVELEGGINKLFFLFDNLNQVNQFNVSMKILRMILKTKLSSMCETK